MNYQIDMPGRIRYRSGSTPWLRIESVLVASLVAALALCMPSCQRQGSSPRTRDGGPIRAVVTLAPLNSLVSPLLPPDAEIRTLITPGRSEHGFEPTVEDVLTLERADLVVLIGLGLETSVDRALRRRPLPTRHEARVGEILGLEGSHAGHDHDDHSDHDHAVDPHVWLDPVLMKQAMPQLAAMVKVVLNEAGVGSPEEVDAAAASLIGQIDEVDAEYRAALAPLAGRAIITHHAAFGRLAERYGLRVVEVIRPIEGAEPTPANIAATMEAIKREGVGAIFVEPQFDSTGARRLAERAGVDLGTLDPLGTGDWFIMMRANLQELVSKLGN